MLFCFPRSELESEQIRKGGLTERWGKAVLNSVATLIPKDGLDLSIVGIQAARRKTTLHHQIIESEGGRRREEDDRPRNPFGLVCLQVGPQVLGDVVQAALGRVETASAEIVVCLCFLLPVQTKQGEQAHPSTGSMRSTTLPPWAVHSRIPSSSSSENE